MGNLLSVNAPAAYDVKFIATVCIIVLVVLFVKDHIHKFDRWASLMLMCPSCAREAIHTHHRHTKSNEDVHIAEVGQPLFNVREAAKQCVALEDHLEHPEKRCQDCIRKHFSLIELFLEEAIGLDRYGKHQALLCDKPARVRQIIKEYNRRHDYLRTSQAIRDMRKEFINASFESV